MTLLWGLAHSVNAQAPASVLATVREAQQSGDFQTAAEKLNETFESSPRDLAVEFVGLARSAKGHLDDNLLESLYQNASKSLEFSDASPPTSDQRFLIRVFAANAIAKNANTEAAQRVLQKAFDEASSLEVVIEPARESAASELALKLAHQSLTAGDPLQAQKTYESMVQYFQPLDQQSSLQGKRETQYGLALMGLGWATAGLPQQKDIAANQLMRFVDRFPSHQDAAGSAAMRVYCLSKAGSSDGLDIAVDEFLERWPDHESAVSVVQLSIAETASPERPSFADLRDSVRDWIARDRAEMNWPFRFAAQVVLVAGNELPPTVFERAVRKIAKADKTGQVTADLLGQLSETKQGSIAESIAVAMVSYAEDSRSPMAIEAACRWAAREGHWPMLSMQALEIDLDANALNQTPTCSRLFAEALTQTGQTKTAFQWWSFVVDELEMSDFPTLLRCAETAVSTAPIAQARTRLEQLRRSVSNQSTSEPTGLTDAHDPTKAFWIDLLEADLAIRSIDFDSARNSFEKVVRSPAAKPSVQGRAQWMIGETYFMQKRYKEAIDAYRRVDGMDADGPFVAAALVQAGKSFEQLGRTQEAGVCYGTLIARHADSSYAREARQRMAALPTNRSGKTNPNAPIKR